MIDLENKVCFFDFNTKKNFTLNLIETLTSTVMKPILVLGLDDTGTVAEILQ